MIRRPPRSTQSRSSAASDVYKRQHVTSPARLWRSTGPVDRPRSRSTGLVDRRAQGCARSQPFRLVDRAVDRLKSTHSRVGPVDRVVDRCSLVLGAVDRRARPTGSTVRNLTVGRSTGRSTGRSFLTFLPANGQIWLGPLYTPILGCFSLSFSRENFLHLKCFISSFKRVLEL